MHRGLRAAGVLLAVFAAVLVVLSEGELRWPDRLGGEAPPAEAPDSAAPAGGQDERSPQETASAGERRPESGAREGSGPAAGPAAGESDLARLFPARGELGEVQETLRLIAAGGPFPYRKDGSVFRNREGRLPRQPSGYYREYTVETPGEDDRGARRIVQGREGETWYTRDHYGSFTRIDPEEVLRAP